MNRSTPGLPVHHQLPEFTQTHVHRVIKADLISIIYGFLVLMQTRIRGVRVAQEEQENLYINLSPWEGLCFPVT